MKKEPIASPISSTTSSGTPRKKRIPASSLAGSLLAVAGLVLALAPAAQAAAITIAFSDASADDGTLDEATETFSQNVSGFNGTDASFDLVVTAVAENGVWIDHNDTGDLGITLTGENNTQWDQAGENGDFTVAIANFVAGTSGYTEANVDFGMRLLTLNASSGNNDSGIFDLINGGATSLTWQDGNGGSDFPGMGENEFDLQVMNGGLRVTSFSLNHTGTTSNSWRMDTLAIEYEFVVISEPATTLAITSITSLGDGNWELTLKGEASTAYEFRSSTTLAFSGTLVTPLTQGDLGEPGDPGDITDGGDTVTTDGSGDATVQMFLGDLGAVSANFVRAETPTP